MKYRVQETQLNSGDVLYLYTDGVTEANNPESRLYGEQRLLDYLNSAKELSVSEMLLGVQKDKDLFAENAEQFYDITMLAVKNR